MGRLFNLLGAYLDRLCLFRIQIWEFSFRSLPREYARIFFFRVVASHPIKAILGLRRYQRYVDLRPDVLSSPQRFLFIPEEQILIERMAGRQERPLVGLGFCLKPHDPEKAEYSCPSGRANHDCLYLERGEVRPVCAGCVVFKIAGRCLETGCPVYIMTSAKDMAKDFMLPQIKGGAFPAVILLLCPYSVQAIIPPLLICGVEFVLLAYEGGNCRDYGEWLMADRGVKDEQTSLAAESWPRLFELLDKLRAVEASRRRSLRDRRFHRRGNIFHPE